MIVSQHRKAGNLVGSNCSTNFVCLKEMIKQIQCVKDFYNLSIPFPALANKRYLWLRIKQVVLNIINLNQSSRCRRINHQIEYLAQNLLFLSFPLSFSFLLSSPLLLSFIISTQGNYRDVFVMEK